MKTLNVNAMVLALGLGVFSTASFAALTVSGDLNPDPNAEYYDFNSPGVGASFNDSINLTITPYRDLVAVVGGTGTGTVDFSLFNLYAASDLVNPLAIGTLTPNGARFTLGYVEAGGLGGNFVIKISGTASGAFTGYTGNITLTTPVPEPETYAMMLAGLGLMGFTVRRRRT